MADSRDIHIKIANDAIARDDLAKALLHLSLVTGSNNNDYDCLYLLAHLKILLGHQITCKNKLAFVVNWQMHIDQFNNIWKHLPIDLYEIILHQHPYEAPVPLERYYYPTREYLIQHNLPFVDLSDCIKNLVTYKLAMYIGYAKVTFPETDYAYKLTNKPARIMSQAYQSANYKDIARYNYLFLQGHNQLKEVYETGFQGDAFVVGYPRFDEYFQQDGCAKDTLSSSIPNFDAKKKTILWTPTHEVFSSLWYYSEAMALLTKSYNVILKLPLSRNWTRVAY